MFVGRTSAKPRITGKAGSRIVQFKRVTLGAGFFRALERNQILRLLGLLSLNLFLCVGSVRAAQNAPSLPQEPRNATSQSAAPPQVPASVSGRVVDPTGVGVTGATIALAGADREASQQAVSDSDGRFSFADVKPGPIRLTIAAEGFATQEFSGNAQPAQTLEVPQITLSLASVTTEVRVVPPQVIAEAQIKEQEKQRALGIVPNYYVSYIPNAAPLVPRQKFELAWKTMLDPVSFGIAGAVAGIQQAQNDFSGYGQGAQGYAKRFAASYADDAIGTFLGGAIFPSLFKQDPRYFYKGTGSKHSRLLYAVANSVICKGDNGHWQANYSAVLGSLAAGGISNLYYPSTDRNGVRLTFENALIGIGANAAANVLQEFVVRKLTPNLPSHDPASSSGGKTRSLVGRAFSSLGSLMRDGD